jgi:phosphoglycolate phosphatase
MGYEAIIFDLDGTLLDTLKDLALSVNAVLKRFGYPEHPVQTYRYMIGDGIEILACRALPSAEAEKIGEEKLTKLVEAVRGEYRRRWADHTYAYPGVSELLDFLERQGIPKAIFSNKPHEFTVMTVGRLLTRWHFEVVQGGLPDVPRKPDPAGVLDIARRIGVKPGATVYLGDSKGDMQAAVAAGVYPVGALWGFRDAAELLAGGARMLAESPLELVTIFNQP